MMNYPLLDNINTPGDIKHLKEEELPLLCEEIRLFLIDTLSRNPGHLGAGLGVVELTVALHYVYDTPEDKLIWDVGHQAYPHKVLTGRKDRFETLRKWNGLSGFPSRAESSYDAFIAGHASNSISAALGFSVANRLCGRKEKVVAIIGDGSMTGGLAFEGINNASNSPNDLLIILNDNNMSIDPSTGGLNKALVDLITNKTYNKLRYTAYKGLSSMNLMDKQKKKKVVRFHNSIKSLFSEHRNLFNGFDVRYFGPVDGHDVIYLVKVLRDIKEFSGPKLLHLITTKGKGYKPAEESQVVWHAPGKFNSKNGERLSSSSDHPQPPRYQDVFGETLVELAEMDERVVGVTPAMATGCSMTLLQKRFPERTFDVGIAEGHAVTFSAGLSLSGLIPFCNIYSTFSQRAYDNIIHDVAMQKAPVIFCFDRAGLVGEDGCTHHGLYDIASLRTIPGLVLCSPRNEMQLRNMMYTAYKHPEFCPIVIRYPRGSGHTIEWKTPLEEMEIGKGEKLKEGKGIAVLTYGPIVCNAIEAIDEMQKNGEPTPALYDMKFVKPLDDTILREILSEGYKAVITIEDGSRKGGIGSAILEWFSEYSEQNQSIPKVYMLGIDDEFIPHGSVPEQYAYSQIDTQSILKKIKAVYASLL
ncbi:MULTISPECIES: 1-deoxy-D-xylulose-5-phosphate synthase [Porphyromonas]|uniref:1-deoxy-D-xylulose-5-phosphate synthase n=1 Tax=Porphyromonas canoris TaxID=36875 RepID=A0ABR4XMN3_9PORP|nr:MULTISPECIES: 1-deoxy-D-xylulose-5-phosphate synthase [Porphyromonas]KGL52407.1 1-deoxy-D-xylulose-5-phosphate synthase [Porphyromonas canoris]KGN70553.1 1-deoxy-D-xylulose-5-phosphate synthase [Porphyromonas sp. COT-108 OH1349]KGN93361.1 1-deoxy-D-xylulose-5-phosphate synthase [Porphyromonas canoris]